MRSAHFIRTVRFSAAHRYHRPEWSEERNRRVFGACSNPHGHGHNYALTVTVRGSVDPETGFAVDLGLLDNLLDRVVRPLDHQHLNYVVEEFGPGGEIPTTENILHYLWPRLVSGLPGGTELVRLRLAEDETIAAEIDRTCVPAPQEED